MQGKKKVFKNTEIKVFKTDESLITIQLVLDQVRFCSDVLSHLPNNPEVYARDKEYLFAVVNTVDSKFFPRLIEKKRNAAKSLKLAEKDKLPKTLSID